MSMYIPIFGNVLFCYAKKQPSNKPIEMYLKCKIESPYWLCPNRNKTCQAHDITHCARMKSCRTKIKKKKTKKIPSKYSDYVHSFDQCSFEWTNTIFDSLLVLYKKEMALLCVHTNYNKLYRYNINSTHAKLTKAVTKFFIFLFIIKLRDKFSF